MNTSERGEGNVRADRVIDINHAALEELVSVPGIGKALASRIIAGRPYIALEELQLVPGIGARLMERIRPYLTLSLPSTIEVEEDEPELDDILEAPDLPETAVVAQPERHESPDIIELPAMVESSYPREAEGEYAGNDKDQSAPRDPSKLQMVPVNRAASERDSRTHPTPTPTPAAKQETFKRGQVITLVVGFSLLSLLLAVILSLGIIGLVNRSLVFVPAAQFELLNRDIDTIASQVDVLDQDIDDLRTRMETYESISGRVKGLEQDSELMQQDLDDHSSQLGQLETQLEQVDGQITEIEKRSELIDIFLNGLRNLLFNMPEITGDTE